MAIKPRWGVRCQARLTDGSRQCKAFAVTGCRTCRAHGSGTQAAIAAGLERAEIAKAWLIAGRELARRLAALDERRERDPEGLNREISEYLRSIEPPRRTRGRDGR